MSLRILTPLEARVLAVLVEKQATVPDSYPLSLNALTLGCNQKTARHLVMNAAEADVLEALEAGKALSLVVEVSGNRVTRFEHNLGRALGVPSQAVALLALLILRGPLTAAELRLYTERLHRFADVSSVEGFLEELAAAAEPRVARLARAPGEREARWMHLLCGGAPAAGSASTGMAADVEQDERATLRAEQRRLAGEVALLREQLDALAAELGVTLKR